MLFNTTYVDNAITREINTLLGKPYSFLRAIQLKGTGSHRMMIEEVSPHFRNVLNANSDINYANIELRPKGVIVHFKKFTEHFSWIIPFYSLSIIQSNSINIHSKGSFIKLHLRSKNTIPFIQKIIHQVGNNYSENPTY